MMSHIYLYLLSSSSPSLFLQRQVFDGNNDVFSFMSVTNLFPVAFMARYVRIVINEWEAWPAMRFEILGCQGTWAIILPGILELVSILVGIIRQTKTGGVVISFIRCA